MTIAEQIAAYTPEYSRFFKLHNWGKRPGNCRRRFIQGSPSTGNIWFPAMVARIPTAGNRAVGIFLLSQDM